MKDFEDMFEKLLRFSLHLPSDGGQDLIVLKGHLLIEEVISDILAAYLAKSNPLGINLKNNLMFNQKMNLCWALTGDKFEDEFWRSVKLLNSIRNSMAHSIDPKNIDNKIKLFTETVIQYSDFNHQGYSDKDLEFSISWLFVGFNSYLQNLRKS